MGTTQSTALPAIDVEAWRQRIRQDTSARYHGEMGAAIEREGNASAAAEAYRRALFIRPDLAVASYRLMRLLAAAGETNEADAVRSAARAIDGAFEIKAMRAIAAELIERNETANARALLEQARQFAPDDPSVVCLLDLCRFFEEDPVVAVRPAGIDDAMAECIGQLYGVLGFRKINDRDRGQAKLCFRTALDFDPRMMVASEQLGRLEQQDGNLEEAIRILKASIQETGGGQRTLELLGDIFMQANQPDEAERLFRRLTEQAPGSPHAWVRLGSAAVALERFDEAVRSFQAGLGVDSQLVEAHVNLALVLLPLGRLEEAETHLRFALSRNPADGSSHVCLGAALLLSGRYAEAEKSFLAGQARMGSSAWSLGWLALGRLAVGDTDAAADMAGQAVAREPGSYWAHSIQGLVQHAQNRLAAAAASHAEALALSGAASWPVAWVRGNAAITLSASGDPVGAAAAARTAARAAPAWLSYQQGLRPEWARSALKEILSTSGVQEN